MLLRIPPVDATAQLDSVWTNDNAAIMQCNCNCLINKVACLHSFLCLLRTDKSCVRVAGGLSCNNRESDQYVFGPPKFSILTQCILEAFFQLCNLDTDLR